ncbi:hypothetical protein DPEC_G00202010 [Dallia pectoralis]|uniref:Uncharacterized protein n=1 Tax=Dallia pectoralis TaxID=75939 RepID=A0ACC2G9E6_DALPE|nr:hypothetical protein DPEC_G00202010 [Dallia pectoralis]
MDVRRPEHKEPGDQLLGFSRLHACVQSLRAAGVQNKHHQPTQPLLKLAPREFEARSNWLRCRSWSAVIGCLSRCEPFLRKGPPSNPLGRCPTDVTSARCIAGDTARLLVPRGLDTAYIFHNTRLAFQTRHVRTIALSTLRACPFTSDLRRYGFLPA